ncbi:ISLre2 family transposase, partial [Streptococcus suis]
LTYRMKKRGMYWSVHGLDRMSRLILLNTEGQIRDLFFGEWREQYQLFTPLESADAYLQDNSNKDYGERLKGTITQTKDRKSIKNVCF